MENKQMSAQEFLVVGLVAQTSIHAGSGDSDGAVDLPIQREAHNSFPVIYGSSVKGALRAAAATRLGNEKRLITLFGPSHLGAGATADSIHAGALLISDARLLWLPVRSLTTHTRYLTCPAILRRLVRDLARGGAAKAVPDVTALTTKLAGGKALVADSGSKRLYLEEYCFDVVQDVVVARLAEFMASFAPANMAEEVKALITVVSDDDFSHLARAAVPVQPHIAINSASKTVVPGALWYEESLPPETAMYLVIGATRARDGGDEGAGHLLADYWQNSFAQSPFVQVGANETTGMGWFVATKVEA